MVTGPRGHFHLTISSSSTSASRLTSGLQGIHSPLRSVFQIFLFIVIYLLVVVLYSILAKCFHDMQAWVKPRSFTQYMRIADFGAGSDRYAQFFSFRVAIHNSQRTDRQTERQRHTCRGTETYIPHIQKDR